MTPDRLRQIEELYHSARESSAEERVDLLAHADPDLRREVESLLAHSNADLPPLDAPTLLQMQAGARLGPYEIKSKLGQGGMGEVYRAVDTRLGRAVAVKVVDPQFIARFGREARAISSLNHPHICTLYDVGPNYLVMELLEGETLSARLTSGPLPVDAALRYAAQIAAALIEAHERGIIHRDLKPGNVMLTKSGAKVLDFGLATQEGQDTITAGHMAMGTPAYMAPEQREGEPCDARTDIYSFGRVLSEMLTGKHGTDKRKPLPSLALKRIVARCLETDPARRWQSAAELDRALRAAPKAISGRKWIFAAPAMFAIALIAAYFVSRPARTLTDRDTVVLADFVNTTGDPVFEGTLRQGIAIQLEQSPFLKILDDAQVRQDMRLMSLPAGSLITNQIAHEVCVREGAAATIDGAIASLGGSYVITLQAAACQDGATLAREQLQAGDKEHVLNTLGTAATEMRSKLGESLNSIQRLNRPLEQATTFSLEALKDYTTGYSEMVKGNSLSAVPLLERAIALDPKFATAQQFLAVAFEVAGEMEQSRAYSEQAYRSIERVSEYERDLIAPYYHLVNGELDKAIDGYQLGIRTYPRSWAFHNNLSMIYIDMGQYEEGLKEGLEAARLQANAEPAYRRQFDAYICTGHLAEAKQLAEKLRTRMLDGARIHQRFLEMAYVEEDEATADREIQWFAGKPEEYLSPGLQAASRNLHGRRGESHRLYQQAAELARRKGLRNASAEFEEADVQADALAGNCRSVHRLGRPALALAICGEAAQAEKIAAETSKSFPNGTIWNAVQLPEIRAAMALKRGRPAEAVELLASASPYERAFLAAIYLRGLSYLRLRKGAEAAAEFQKITEHKGANWASAWRYPYWGQFYSLSYLGLGRAFAVTGDTAKATKAFEDLFTLWKDADRDLPVLIAARKEYAKLRLIAASP